MDFGVLGPLRVLAGERLVHLGPRLQRMLLALLLCHRGRPVATSWLLDAVWGPTPPASAADNLYLYIHRLRAGLGPGRIIGRGDYTLVASPDEVDACRFADLAETGQRALADGDPATASARLHEALALWRGTPFVDLDDQIGIAAYTAQLRERHLAALEQRIDADLALGWHRGLVAELTTIVSEHAYRERFRAQLMLALYRSGRQAEALEIYRVTRQVLADDLGLEPGPELRRVHRAILTGDPELELAVADSPVRAGATSAWPSGPVPAQLAADVPDFTGRSAELAQLAEFIGGGAPGTGVTLTVITGTPGVGKTALAVHWAHRLRDRYPDGQLYVNLHGYDSGEPARPAAVLSGFLRALGVTSERIPATLDEAASLFRTVLAGKRVMVALDNAASAEQVRPLLPGSLGCLVVVTSRDRMDGLVARDGARRLTLDVLSPMESRLLLSRVVGQPRMRAEPRAVDELAQACAYLPLALRITAATLINHPQRTIGEQVRALRSGDQLGALEVPDDVDASVRAAFTLSYQTIPMPAQRLFRLLSLSPCHDLTAPAAAALGGLQPAEATQLLERLARAHLVHEVGSGRFGFHDLLREYAKRQTEMIDSVSDREHALRALFDWYLNLVDSAARVVAPHVPHQPRPDGRSGPHIAVGGPREALALLDAERRNLLALICHASRHEPRPMAWLLTDRLRPYLDQRRLLADMLTAARAALTAARAEDDSHGEAAALQCLANAYHCAGRHRTAISHLRRVAELSRKAGWDEIHLVVLRNLGAAHMLLGELPQATHHLTRALDLARPLGRRDALAPIINNLAMTYCDAGRPQLGLELATESLALFTELQSAGGVAAVQDTLGNLNLQLGRLDSALAHINQALAINRDLDARAGQTNNLVTIARIHHAAGDLDRARTAVNTALNLAREIGDRHAQAHALNTLGSISYSTDNACGAAELHQTARRLAETIGSQYPIAEACIGLARASAALGDHASALAAAGRAHRITRRHQLLALEQQVLGLLANLRQATSVPQGRRHREAAEETATGLA